MRFRRASADSWELRDIHPLFASLLAELPRSASRHKKAQARIYPDPTGGTGDAQLRADWKEHVRPELERLFATSRDIVARDVEGLGSNGHGNSLVIPGAHLDAWLNTLNQARLVLVEENEFSDADLGQSDPPDLATRRGLALLRIHFYAHLQELLIEASN